MSTHSLITAKEEVAVAGWISAESSAFEPSRSRWDGWWLRRRPGLWVAPCRDEARRRRQLQVVLIGDGRVALVAPPGEVAVLGLLEVGRLRAVLRDAVWAVEEAHQYDFMYRDRDW